MELDFIDREDDINQIYSINQLLEQDSRRYSKALDEEQEANEG